LQQQTPIRVAVWLTPPSSEMCCKIHGRFWIFKVVLCVQEDKMQTNLDLGKSKPNAVITHQWAFHKTIIARHSPNFRLKTYNSAMTSKGSSVVQGIGQLTSIQYNAKTNPVWAFLRITSARPVDIQLNSANTTDPTTPAWQHGFPCSEDSRAYTLHTTAAWDWRGARPRRRYQHTARMVASGGFNLRTCTEKQRGIGLRMPQRTGGWGWRGC